MDTSGEQKKREAIVEGARFILEKKNFEEAARAVFNYCKELTHAKSGYIALLTEKGRENDAIFLEAGGLPCTVDPELPMPVRGLRAVAYTTQKVVIENDFMNTEWMENMPSGHADLNNVMFAPLTIDGKAVGIMGLANKTGGFNDRDAELAGIFGEMAALALQNSRLIERLNQLRKSLLLFPD